MCGRYSFAVDERKLEERFGAKFIAGHEDLGSVNDTLLTALSLESGQFTRT